MLLSPSTFSTPSANKLLQLMQTQEPASHAISNVSIEITRSSNTDADATFCATITSKEDLYEEAPLAEALPSDQWTHIQPALTPEDRTRLDSSIFAHEAHGFEQNLATPFSAKVFRIRTPKGTQIQTFGHAHFEKFGDQGWQATSYIFEASHQLQDWGQIRGAFDNDACLIGSPQLIAKINTFLNQKKEIAKSVEALSSRLETLRAQQVNEIMSLTRPPGAWQGTLIGTAVSQPERLELQNQTDSGLSVLLLWADHPNYWRQYSGVLTEPCPGGGFFYDLHVVRSSPAANTMSHWERLTFEWPIVGFNVGMKLLANSGRLEAQLYQMSIEFASRDQTPGSISTNQPAPNQWAR